MYLLGSIHFMQQDAYPLGSAIEAAYERSEILMFETDISGLDQAAVALMTAGSLEEGVALEDVITPELYDDVTDHLESLGHDASAFKRMKPWMVALSLTSLELMRAGYLGSEGIDAHFSSRASADGKQQRWLETIDEQIALFTELTEEEGEEFLAYTLVEVETVIPFVGEIVDAWRAGDAKRLEAMLAEGFEEHPEMFERMVTNRNRNWLPAIEALFDGPADAMVVVGALHLVGDEGLVALLRAKGYEVEQL